VSDLTGRVLWLEREVARLSRRIGSPFALARTTNAPDDSGAVQTVQAQLDPLSTRDGIPVMYHYGFGSVPPIGTDLHIAYLDGDRSKGIVIASGNQAARLSGKSPGDAWMAGHDFSIVINAGGINITGNVTHNGNYTLDGTMAITGALTATQGITAGAGGADQVTLQKHVHVSNGVTPTPGT
jgi:phage gp45-like